jgi:hypothetical protein
LCDESAYCEPWPTMLTIAIIVFVLWLLGLFFFKAAKGLIHLLLLAAVVIVLFHFFGGG